MYRLGQSGMVSALHGEKLQRAHGVNPAVVLFPLHAHPAHHSTPLPAQSPPSDLENPLLLIAHLLIPLESLPV